MVLPWCRALVGVALNVSLGYVEKKAAEDGLRNQDVLRDAALGMMGNVIRFASRAVAFLEFVVRPAGYSPRQSLCTAHALHRGSSRFGCCGALCSEFSHP